MPGKINPVMTEVMILACHRVAGNQAGVGFGAFSGELDLGASSAVPIRSILNSIDILSRSMVLFADKCVNGLSANAEKCLHAAERSTSLATMVKIASPCDARSCTSTLSITANGGGFSRSST